MITTLSVGLVIYEILSQNEDLRSSINKIFPVVAEETAELPYICYRRTGLSVNPTKAVRGAGADSTEIEIAVFASTYSESIKIAELIRQAMEDAHDLESDVLSVRAINLTDADEFWDSGAYIQTLTYTIKINEK